MKFKKTAGILLFVVGAINFIGGLTRYFEVTDPDRIRNSIIIMICGIVLMIIGFISYRKSLKGSQKP